MAQRSERAAGAAPSKLLVRRLRPEARVPRYESEGAAGLDLCACLPEALSLPPGERLRVPTGIAVALPPGHEGQVRPRSGLAFRHGVTVANAPGTIDEDFRGELEVLLINLGAAPYAIEPGARIAQLVIAPVHRAITEEVHELPETGRGTAGFGSTGTGP